MSMSLYFPQAAEKLTTAERSILEFIENHREEVLFMTIGQLAEELGVSEATISRFARHMGCQDFKKLKAVIMDQYRPEGPVWKMAGTLLQEEPFCMKQYLIQQQMYLQKTAEHLDEAEFQQAIQELLLANHIYIHGKSASASIAQLLFFRLRRLGMNVSLLPSGGSEILESLSQIQAGDVVVMFAFSKVSWEGGILLDHQKEVGYHTVAFTSRLHAAKEDLANVNLYIYRGRPSEYHSMTAAFAVADAFIIALSEKLGANGAKHLKYIHDMKKLYTQQSKRTKLEK